MAARIKISGVILFSVSQTHIYLDVKTVACEFKISYLPCFLQYDGYPNPVGWMRKFM